MTIHRFVDHGQWPRQMVRSLEEKELEDQGQGGLDLKACGWTENVKILYHILIPIRKYQPWDTH